MRMMMGALLAVATTAAAQVVPPPAATAPAVDAAPPVAVRVVPATPVAAPVKQPLICHTSIETGSLIARHKQCLTAAQWRYVDDVQRQQTQQLFDDQRGKPGCNGPSC